MHIWYDSTHIRLRIYQYWNKQKLYQGVLLLFMIHMHFESTVLTTVAMQAQ